MVTSPAEVLWTARYDYQPHAKLERHKHKFFQIICVASGEGRFWLDGREIPIVPKRVFLIKPGQMHGLIASSHIRTFDLKFVVRNSSLKQALLSAPDFIEEQRAAISTLMEHVRAEGERRGIFFREMCATYLVQLLVAYLQENEGKSKATWEIAADNAISASDVVRRALDFIAEHYREDLDGCRLARALGASDRQLRHWFKQSVDTSPMHYLVWYRIEKAKDLIKSTDYALKEIAERCGFKSIHHFNHVFAEMTGQPPGAWRRQQREGVGKDVCIDPHFSNVILVRQNEDDAPAPSV